MKKQSVFLTILIVITSILLIASAGLNVYLLNKTTNTAYEFIASYSLIATSIFAIYYIVSGCNKAEGAAYFKIFMVLAGLNQLVSIYDCSGISNIATILSTMAYGFICVLSIALNLGQKRSLFLAYATFVCLLAKTFYLMKLLNLSLGLASIKLLTALLISFAAIIMVYAKYHDKAKRGSK